MVVPNRHIGSLAEASSEELSDLMTMTRRAEIALTEAYRPHGLNMGINLGRPAGAGVPGHLHMHVVPRWNGDTNFMTVVGQTPRRARGAAADRDATHTDLRTARGRRVRPRRRLEGLLPGTFTVRITSPPLAEPAWLWA